MKRRALRIVIWALILCLCVGTAVAEEFPLTPDSWFKMGIDSLKDITEENIQQTVEFFQAAGNYPLARKYKLYATSLQDIFLMDSEEAEVDIETTIYRLEDISQYEDFAASLAENGFMPCDTLILYIEARLDERNGEYIAARKIYATNEDVLDALERKINLTPRAYRQAEELYRQGSYDAVVEALKDMTYKDSEAMYRESLKYVDHLWAEADCTHPRTCSIHGETEGEPLGHKWKEATCTEPRTCVRCGLTEGEPAGHDWMEATCTAPRTCSRCGATTGEALGHVMTPATCTEPSVCTRCGAAGQAALGHDWTAATCTEPSRCTRCGLTNGTALGHNWTSATCTEPQRCTRCGITNGTAPGHNWTSATCTEPQRCTRCGTTSGTASGHSWTSATCTEPSRCTRCGALGQAALGHSWQEATYSSPKRCSRCGLTEGSALTPTPEPKPSKITGRAIDKLSLNAGPGSARKYKELGTYDMTGKYVELLARSYDSGNNIWWIKCTFSYGGRTVTGWTGLKRFDQSTFNLNDLPVE